MQRRHWVLAILILTFSCISRGEDPRPQQTQYHAPNWILQTVQGNQISLYDELQANNTVVMVFWATWCKYCEELLPKLNAYAETLTDSHIRLYALNIWEDGDPKQYLADRHITIDTILNAETQARQFQVTATPEVIAIAPNKTIVYRRKGGESSSQIIAALESLK